MIVTLYTTRVLLQVLGIEDYGIYNVVCGFVTMFGFLNTSLSQGIQRYYNYELGTSNIDGLKSVYKISLIIQSLLAFTLLIIIELVGFFWFEYKIEISQERLWVAKWIFQFSVCSLIIGILQVPYSAMIMAFERMNYYAIVSIIDAILKLLMVLILPYISYDKLLFYGILNILISIFNFLFYYIYYKCHLNLGRDHLVFKRTLFKSMLSFSGWNTLGSLSSVAKNQGLNILLNSYFGAIINAAYGISAQIMSAIQQFSLNIIIAFRPQMVTAYSQGNYTRVKSMMYAMSKITFILIYMISVPIIIEIDTILKLWLGNNIPEYANTLSVLAIISILLFNFNTPITQVIHAIGKMKKYQITTSIITLSIIPFSMLLLHLGMTPNTVYWVTIFIALINQVIALKILHSLFDFSYKEYTFKVVLPCLLIAILNISIPYYVCSLFTSSIIRLITVCFTSVLVTIITSYHIALDKSEKEVIQKFRKKQLKSKNSTL